MPDLVPIFAFGIVNLPMLGWLAAAAAPILIHLWNRQKYRETPWAAMEYLLAALKRHTRRLRLEQWLLLAVRTLLVVLLVLAVAEPYFQRIGLVSASAQRTHRVLVIDGSYSMAYRPGKMSRFDRARQLARQIVEEGRQGDAFTLLLMASPPRLVVGTPAFEADEMLREIDHLRLLHTTAELPVTVAMVRQLTENVRRENPELVQHEVYFLTDLDRAAWMPNRSDAAWTEFRRQSRELAESATLMVIDLGQPAAENVAITGFRSPQRVTTLGQSIDFEATLKNFGRQAQMRQTVELLVDGRRVDRKEVELPPSAEASLAFSHDFEIPGDHTLEVRAAGDALDVDNHRFLAIPVRQSIRVLCIDGRPSGEPFGGATDYLVYALAPDHDRREGLVRVDVAPESALLEKERELGSYDCVFLGNVAQFTANEARVLDAYLDNGGSLVFFLGDQVLGERYNQELGGRAGGPRLLPAFLGTIVAGAASRIDPLGYEHPIVHEFRAREQAGLLTALIYKHFRLTLPENSAAKVVLKTVADEALIVEESIRRGRVILVATSADISWTDMPARAGYVPLMQELLTHCLGGQLEQRNVQVGQSLEASLATSAADVSLRWQTPTGASRPLRLHGDGDYAVLSYADTTTSGIYTARLDSPGSQAWSFAVNVDTAESDLTHVDENQLRNEVWPGVPFLHRTTWQNVEQPPTESITRRQRLHVDLLYVVLGLLFVETFLAWRFGHHTQ